jgi:hypothetical protein
VKTYTTVWFTKEMTTSTTTEALRTKRLAAQRLDSRTVVKTGRLQNKRAVY